MNVDIDLQHADWPKRTPDTMKELEQDESEETIESERLEQASRLLWRSYP